VAAFATACRAFLPYALHRLESEHPDLATALVEVNPHEGLEMLHRGHADLAVLDDWPEAALHYPPGIARVELGRDVADLIARRHSSKRATAPSRDRSKRGSAVSPGRPAPRGR
jgi:DNA-binding transcriptional LysR family regulator